MCVYHIFFICISVCGHLCCFHILVIVNSAAVNIGVHESFQIIVLSGYMPGSRIAGYVVVLYLGFEELLVFEGCLVFPV